MNLINSDQCIIQEKLQTLEETIKDSQNPLDFPMTWEELTSQTKSLQPRNTCGPDSIKIEMLKCSSPEMQGAVLKLFNTVLQSGCFPDIWCKGFISPNCKSGTNQILITTVASVSAAVWVNYSVVFSIKEY